MLTVTPALDDPLERMGRILLLTACCAMLLTGIATGKSSKVHYKGLTAQNAAFSLTVKNGKVTHVDTSINVGCPIGRFPNKTVPVKRKASLKIKKHKFHGSLKGPPGFKIHGTFSGKTVTGSVTVPTWAVSAWPIR